MDHFKNLKHLQTCRKNLINSDYKTMHFAQIIHSYPGVSDRTTCILNPCPLMTVHTFA